MPEFDPIKLFKWVWSMRWWGKALMVSTVIATGLAFVSFFTILPQLWFGSIAVVFWVALIISYVVISAKTHKSIDNFIYKGNNLIARIPETCDRLEDTDKYSWLDLTP